MKRRKTDKSSSVPKDNDGINDLVSGLQERISELERQLQITKKNKHKSTGEEYFKDIFETVSEGIVYTTLTGNVISINRALEKILGLPKDQIIGRNIISLAGKFLHSEGKEKILPLLEDLLAGNELKTSQVHYKEKILEVSTRINLKTKRLTGTIRDITESKKTITALRVSETRLKRAELASGSGNWELHLDTGIMEGSEGATKLYGLNSPLAEYSQLKDIPLPEYREMLDKALKDLLNHNKPYNIEFKIKNKLTGEIIDIHSISEYDGEARTIFGSIQDITARKKAEEEIKNKSRDLAKLLDITMDLLEVVDKRKVFGKIVEKGPALLGLKSGAVYTLVDNDLYLEATYPALPDNFPDEFRKASLHNHPHILTTLSKKTHVVINDVKKENLSPEEKLIVEMRGLYSIIYVPLIADKEVVAVLIFGTTDEQHDFTDHEKALCRALSNIASLALENSILLGNLVIAKEKAEESDRLKTAFLHNISHEIRTPLNAIIGFSRMIGLHDLTPEEYKSYYDILEQSNKQLLSIINDILNISHIESGQVVLREKTTDLAQVVKNLYTQFCSETEKKGIVFTLEADASLEKSLIIIDEGKLMQVITNLMNNAVKFTEHGAITLGYKLKDDILEFWIKDTGIGIKETEHQKIFDRFYQVDNSLTKEYGGTGLGLTISNAYVNLMGGKITLTSTLGQGSLFSFTVPFNPSVTIEADETGKSPANIFCSQPLKTIVIAEDDDSNFALISAMLKPLNLTIVHAENGQQVIEICNLRKVDLVLMDIKMPVLNGFEAAAQIALTHPDLPIIAQTAYAQHDDFEKALKCGCADCITKPFNKDELMSLITKYLD